MGLNIVTFVFGKHRPVLFTEVFSFYELHIEITCKNIFLFNYMTKKGCIEIELIYLVVN